MVTGETNYPDKNYVDIYSLLYSLKEDDIYLEIYIDRVNLQENYPFIEMEDDKLKIIVEVFSKIRYSLSWVDSNSICFHELSSTNIIEAYGVISGYINDDCNYKLIV